MTEEARRELDALLSSLDTDASVLERKEERLFALRALARKYGTTPDELAGRAARISWRRQDALDGGGSSMKAAEAAVAAHARGLSGGRPQIVQGPRRRSAKKLEAAVAGELAPLKLGHAKFRVALDALTDDDGTASGLENIAFEVATVEGAAFGSLAKIASGGELARFSLALEGGAGPDRAARRHGVRRSGSRRRRRGGRCGGRTAAAPGRNHPGAAGHPFAAGGGPRGAAFPHFPRRRQDPHRRLLDDDARLEEIARMLSGANVTDEARAAAKRLVAEAAAPKKTRKRAK